MAGWAPSFQDCARCGALGELSVGGQHSAMVVQMGGIVCDECAAPGSPRLDAETIDLLSALLTGDWEHAAESPERAQSQAAGVVAAYTQWHLGRGLRSLEHVAR
jgi:DNA repair protein RecO (recombination protein O)